MRSSGIKHNELPSRPGFGAAGRAITLRSNFFSVNVPKGPFYEYDVQMNPTATNKRLRRRVYQLAEQTKAWKEADMPGKVAHDHGTRLLSCFKLPQPLTIAVSYTEEEDGDESFTQKRDPKEYVLTIRFTGNLDTQAMIQYAPPLVIVLRVIDHAHFVFL